MKFPRRNSISHLHPTELALREVGLVVEETGCDVKLTNALNKVHEARELVADYLEQEKGYAKEIEI